MNIKHLLLLFVIPLTLFSCSKDKNDGDENEIVQEKCQVLSIVDKKDNSIMMTYDQVGKLIKGVVLEPSEANWKAESNFTYTANTITVKGYDDVEYTLDNQGRIATARGLLEDEGYHNMVFTYNAGGYLTKLTSSGKNYVTTEEYIYTNDNLTTVKHSVVGDNGYTYSETITLTYDSSKKYNDFNSLIADFSMLMSCSEGSALGYLYEMGYVGKRSKNRVASLLDEEGNSTKLSYEEDAKGKVTKVTANLGEQVNTFVMTQTCK